jgi:hypothetical protein
MDYMNKRGAYFFVIDALIAGSIIFISLLVIFTTHNMRPEPAPTLRMIQDYTNFLTKNKIREFSGPYVQSLVNDSNITNLDNTMLEQLVQFYYENQTNEKDTTAIMYNYVKEISAGIIPAQRSFALYIYLVNESGLDHTLIYSSEQKPMKDSSLVMSTQKITFKRINETYVYGPLVAEAVIWV